MGLVLYEYCNKVGKFSTFFFQVLIINAINETIFESSPIQPPVAPPPSGQQDIYSFNSFSGVDTAQVGRGISQQGRWE